MRSFTDPETGASLTSNGSAAGDACVTTFARVASEMAAEKQAALAELRAKGIVAVGADDGWIDREKNTWTPPSYATIFEPIKVGDRIALGWPSTGFRIVCVTGKRQSPFGLTYYSFEPAEEQAKQKDAVE
jgi:hypothetical protein